MAVAKFRTPPKPIIIENFYGINESVSNTQQKQGELSLSENFRMTKDFKLRKRPGVHDYIVFGAGDVAGLWQGTLSGKKVMIVCWNGQVYEKDQTIETILTDITALINAGIVTILGPITDAKTCIVWFDDKIYFFNGTDYKEYDGTTYQDVVPYIPIVALNAPPTGGGTVFEEINQLTGEKGMTFKGDGVDTTFVVPEENIDSIDFVTIDDVPAVSFSQDLVIGAATNVNPLPGVNATVKVIWTKASTSNPDSIKNHKYATDFGVGNDTNLFIFGNVNEKRTFRFSGINNAGYFPANSFVPVGSTQFAITDLKPQYQQLLVFKEDSTKIVKPEINPNFAENAGLNPYKFPYFDLNESVGNLAPKMVQLIENNPVSLFGSSMWLWSSATSVEDERNAKIISDRIKLSLRVLNLRNAVTFDYQDQKEYWVNVDDTVYIWNYGNDTMYKYTNINATQYISVDGDIFLGANGKVQLIRESFVADGEVLGDSIPCIGKLGFTDLGLLNLEKNMRDEWISIEPASRTSVTIKFVTDKKNEEQSKEYFVEYILMDFNNVDFDDFSFWTNVNPQPKRIRGKIKKFTYLQTVFENNTNDETLTILEVQLPVTAHRYSG